MIQKLINSLQYYDWGSRTLLTRLYGIANPLDQPIAEMWMGAHPKNSSQIFINNQLHSLHDIIAGNKEKMLGVKVAQDFGQLPFLCKILTIERPLSIQVHPSKSSAVRGFIRENTEGIPISDAKRNYKDSNHKPELIYALSPFKAMNSFRPLYEIVSLLYLVAGAHPSITYFLKNRDKCNLAHLFANLLFMKDKEKKLALDFLFNVSVKKQGEPWQTIKDIAKVYPNDCGLFTPLFLNVINIKPGEAMFLFEKTPHSYLDGIGLEVMANSDNVLRGALTLKYVNVSEFLANLNFKSQTISNLLIAPKKMGFHIMFPIPVKDFSFSIHLLKKYFISIDQQSASIIFCIDGKANIQSLEYNVLLNAGESAFIGAQNNKLLLSGTGKIARVYNEVVK